MKNQSITLDAYYNPIDDIWIIQGGYLYRTIEQLNKEVADAIRWSIQKELYFQYMKDHPYYNLTAV
jgi:hypothetical protein